MSWLDTKCGKCSSEVTIKPFDGLIVSKETGKKYNNFSEYTAAKEKVTNYYLLCKSCSESEPEKQKYSELKIKYENLLVTTTATIDGRNIVHYKGIVSAQVFMGVNIFKDILAGVRDIIGGRSKGIENELNKAKELLIAELKEEAVSLGANAIIGLKIDFEDVGTNGIAFMLLGTGTAVVSESKTYT